MREAGCNLPGQPLLRASRTPPQQMVTSEALPAAMHSTSRLSANGMILGPHPSDLGSSPGGGI
jgi:hypothetical protein